MKDNEFILSNGGVAVIPTDTIYGIVAQAFNKDAVERVYKIKKRTPTKPFIILISSIKDIEQFEINLDSYTKDFLQKYWPGKISIILTIENIASIKKYDYLHRGTNTLAFRIPNDTNLIKILKKTGALIAPSANPEGQKPAETIKEAKDYFGSSVDLYIEGGKLCGESSTIVKIKDGKVDILRQGAVKI